ncbi:MAG: DUF4852 domain-containing protein [Alphaproteobacteria bacterium]
MRIIWLISAFCYCLLAMLSASGFYGYVIRDAHAKATSRSGGYDYLLKSYTTEYRSSEDGVSDAVKADEDGRIPRRYIYEPSLMETFSYLFWAVGLYEYDNDWAIDEFMRINECEIYTNFSADDIEWQQIRDATRTFLKNNNKDFPTRFKFTVNIKLGDYDQKRQAFRIQDDHILKNMRRFEFMAKDAYAEPCSRDSRVHNGYPRALVLELSRPLTLEHVPAEEKQAFNYIKNISEYIRRRYDPERRSRALADSLRNAYLVMKVKIFTHGQFLGLNHQKMPTVQMMGILEGFEVYEDMAMERLIFSQSYVASKQKGKLNERLKEQYELLMSKHESGGILN